MGLLPIRMVPDLRRLAGWVASRSTARWSWLRTFLGFCLLAAVVGGPTVRLPHAQVAAAFAGIPRSAVGSARLSASATSGLAVAFRSDTPLICTVSGATLTPAAAGTCTVTASQGGSDQYAAARDVEQSTDVASATSILPGALTILLAAAVFAAAGGTTLVRRVRRRSRRPRGPQPSVRADPVPGPPALVSVQNAGAGVTHTVHIESSPGASMTTIKEARP